jgi:murein DD-endopeptidase MepM/ murein hydrolase activator NlpD
MGIAAGLAVIVAIVWSIVSAPMGASADDYPTWDEVENARADQANAESEVARVKGLIESLQGEVERTQQIANEKGQIAYEAEEEHQAKILEVNALQTQADEAAALAEVSERRAGQWAAQLVRVGGGDPSLKLFADGGDADDVLTSIGVSSRISQQAKDESERATQQRNTAQALSDQAGVMRVELEKLAAIAAAAFAEAQAANAAAAAALSEQQSKVPELEAMAAYLAGLTNDTEAAYQVGEQKRIEAELEARNQAIDWAEVSGSGWVKPAAGRVTSPYGYSPGYSGHHNGTDLGTGCWAPIIAASSGTVTFAGSYGQLGNWTEIDHGGGVTTGYAHQYQIDVSPGQQVQVGQVIGWSGDTGYSFGCHLHFVVYVWGSRIDPQPFMASQGVYF